MKPSSFRRLATAASRMEPLLKQIRGKFDAFITIDGNLTYQQNLSESRIGIVVLGAVTNAFEDIGPLIPIILKVLETLQPGAVIHVRSEK